MKCKAVIFDLDGTVIDNEPVYIEAVDAVLAKHGIDHRDKRHLQVPGIGVEPHWKISKEYYKDLDDLTSAELADETQKEYLTRLSKVQVRRGFFDLQKRFVASGVKIALATSNDRFLAREVMGKLDLLRCFPIVVTGDDVEHKKPAPDIFLKSAEKLGVRPQYCLVIEDAPAGITAAQKAGMKVIAILNGVTERDALYGAAIVVSSFEDLTPKILTSVFD